MSTKEWRENNQEKMREYRREYYHRNKIDHYARNEVKRDKLRVYLKELKEKPCTDCGQCYPHYVMDFDHVRGEKKYDPASLVNRGSWSVMKKELAKCELVCSNCHRIRTFTRVDGSKQHSRTPNPKG